MSDRDFQRSKVYAWERARFGKAMNGEQLTLDECRELAAAMYGKRVIVKDGRGRRNALAYRNGRVAKIALPEWARNPIVVAHEVAHLITNREGFSGHGGKFVAVHIGLLADHCGESYYELIESARAHGVRVLLPKEEAA